MSRQNNLAGEIRQELLERISSGRYSAGQKIPSVRALMREFSVSSQTVQRALGLLQDDRVITAIQGSGVYVNSRTAAPQLRLAMIFPEQSISHRHLDLESWGISSELYRGLLAGSAQYGVRLEFIHGSAEADEESHRALAAELRHHDAAVFVGRQLSALQQLLSRSLPVFHFSSGLPCPGGVQLVDYDREGAMRALLRQAAASGCRTASCLSYLTGENAAQEGCFVTRAELMLQLCAECGLRALPQYSHCLSPENRNMLPEILSAGMGDFVFCNHAYLVREVFALCRRQHRTPLLGAIGSGFTFQGLYPGMIYMRVPMYEAGQGIVRSAQRLAKGEPPQEACAGLQSFPAELIEMQELVCSLLA